MTWANTLDSDGGPQTKARVKVFSEAQFNAGGFDPATSTATYDSGVLSQATTSHVGSSLLDGTYRAYPVVAQTVNGADHYSDWGSYALFYVRTNPKVSFGRTFIHKPARKSGADSNVTRLLAKIGGVFK